MYPVIVEAIRLANGVKSLRSTGAARGRYNPHSCLLRQVIMSDTDGRCDRGPFHLRLMSLRRQGIGISIPFLVSFVGGHSFYWKIEVDGCGVMK